MLKLLLTSLLAVEQSTGWKENDTVKCDSMLKTAATAAHSVKLQEEKRAALLITSNAEMILLCLEKRAQKPFIEFCEKLCGV